MWGILKGWRNSVHREIVLANIASTEPHILETTNKNVVNFLYIVNGAKFDKKSKFAA